MGQMFLREFVLNKLAYEQELSKINIELEERRTGVIKFKT